MTGRDGLLPPETVPSVARIYDFLLGGRDHYACDRELAVQALAAEPNLGLYARVNRAFLGRAVEYLAGECGVRQFLDLGVGMPTRSNVHQIAQSFDPQCRVVYVDNDPIVLAHTRRLLGAYTAVVGADLRTPRLLLAHPYMRGLIDWSQPVAVLMTAVLNSIPDTDDPYGIVETLVRPMRPGSYLVISHPERTRGLNEAAKVYQGASAPEVPRSRREIANFFRGFDLVPPGLVRLPYWTSAQEPGQVPAEHQEIPAYGGVGVKR